MKTLPGRVQPKAISFTPAACGHKDSARASDAMEKPFDPTEHGFVRISDYNPPQGISFYELRNHPSVDGSANMNRLNCYLSQDGDFITIWQGCLDPIVLDGFLGESGVCSDDYDEPLFRGHIDSREQATHILRALRLESPLPQIIGKTTDGKIVCECLPTE